MDQGDSTGFGTRISIGTAMCRLDRENGLRALDLDSVKPCRTSWLIGASGGEFHKFAMLQLRCGCPDLFLTRKNNGSKPSGNWMLSIALLCVCGAQRKPVRSPVAVAEEAIVLIGNAVQCCEMLLRSGGIAAIRYRSDG